MDVLVRDAATTTSCRPPTRLLRSASRPCARSTWASSTACPAAPPSCRMTPRPPEGMAFRTLRDLYGRVDEHLWTLAGRAAQLVEWDRTHLHCGRCGTPTEHAPGERARRCPMLRPRRVPAPVPRGHRARHSRRRDPAGARAALPGPPSTACWRASSSPASRWRSASHRELRGGGRHRGGRHPLLREPALAVPPLAHDRLHRDVASSGELRIEEAELRRRALVHARRPARSARQPLDRPQADRRLALGRVRPSPPSDRRRSRRCG